MNRMVVGVVIAFIVLAVSVSVSAQTPEGQPTPVATTATVAPTDSVPAAPVASTPAEAEKADEAEAAEVAQVPGIQLPDSERLRIRTIFMAGYLNDPAIASLGYEKQGRIGYAIIDLFGKLNDNFSYRLEINPVDETQPLPACGEEGFFYPNDPRNSDMGPTVRCDPDGRLRVDDYRYLALDVIQQQGPIRQAYLAYDSGGVFGARFGRFILPIGLTWEETGAFTAKDTAHITRINSEANFGLGLFAVRRSNGRPVARADLAAFIGDGNKFRDYSYFYGQDGTLDSNSALTGLLSVSFSPVEEVEVRGAYKFGYTGSKVERLPNFWASKRNDMATVVSARYRPNQHVSVFGEYARYVWGLTRTSAEMLGLDQEPVVKPGYYVGGSASYPVTNSVRIGGSVIREELSRDDSLVKYLAETGLYRSELGKKERAWIVRLFVDLTDSVSVGFFRNSHSNPLPQLSGIVAVGGEGAYRNARADESKYGVAVRFRLQ